ncbi:hypothetical protein [Pleurocapsa sp. PCC 7319]|uniref:hypothetical protein n=1 Tax=Pleurocapsa sp. PCC 7319 TaxID=118161 RepID=UPI0003484994|nr:hypothetical protein [Pleurocapsa sp. PCC 7319]
MPTTLAFFATLIATTSSDTPPASVGTQIVVAIVVALMIAFAVQFLLTNFGLAIGISLLKYRPQTSSKPATESSQSENSGISVNLSFFAGLGILLTLNSVLFIACYLAVRFSTANDPVSGATLGIVIWSTYFLILIWVSYSAVSSVTSWVFGSVATKLRQLIDAIATSIQGTENPALELLTEEAATNLIHQEIQTSLAEFDLQQRIDDYLQSRPSPELDLTLISQGFADLLAQLNLETLAETNLLQKIDRQTFIPLIEERTNLSTSQVEQVVERLENVWQQTVAGSGDLDLNTELLKFLQSANPEELQFEQLVQRLEQLVGKETENNSFDLDERSHQVAENNNSDSVIKRWSNLDWKAIKNALLTRVDLSDIELEDVWHNLQPLYHQINFAEEGLKLPFNTISNDVEDYLSHAPPWHLNCEKGWQEFKEVIYDPEADPVQVRSELEQFQPEDFVAFLQQRDDLGSEKINEIAQHLETVRQEVLSLSEEAEFLEQKQELSECLKNYLQKVELNELKASNLPLKLEQLIIESGFRIETLTQFLSSWQQLDCSTWLQQRQDLEPDELKQITTQFAQIGDRLLKKVTDWQAQISSTAKELQQKLESYLRYTKIDLVTSEKIDAKLEQLWQEAGANLPEIQQIPEIDCLALVKILEKRQGLNEDRIKAIAIQIETNWQKLNSSAITEISPIQTKSAELVENFVDYLYQALQNKLKLAEIEAGLPELLDDTKSETTTRINQQLDRLDWHEIEAKLNQVQQDSELQIQQTIKQLRESIRRVAKFPRRWKTRTSQQVENVVDELEDFFSYSNKIELTAERLEHNLKSIFHRSKASSDSNSDSVDKNLEQLANITSDDNINDNIKKSLAARQDITSVEIAQISDRFIAITEQLSAEMKTKQEETNELVQNLLDRLGDYFSSLNLFHLDYDQIKNSLTSFDFQSLIDSWSEKITEIPLEELGDRLGKLSYESFASIMETKEILPSSSLSQIQGIQDYIAEQIETIKLTASERAKAVKQQTLQQVEATRKAIASATYWMLAIAFSSAVTSAWAGFLATK